MFTLNLPTDQLNVVLASLDAGVHKTVRPVIDNIISQVNEQNRVTAERVEAEPVDVEPRGN